MVMNEILYVVFSIIVSIVCYARILRVLHRLLPLSLWERIQDELSRFKGSTPNLKSTPESSSFSSR